MGSAAGGLENLFLLSQGASAVAGATDAITSAGLYRSQGALENTVSQRNARLADLQAQDALQRGEMDAQRYGRSVKQVQGSGLAAAVSQGLDPTAGTPAEIAAENSKMGALDMLAIRTNAAREAFGYDTRASEMRRSGGMAKRMGRLASKSTLITGGLGFLRGAAQAKIGYDYLKGNGSSGGKGSTYEYRK